MIHQTMDRRRVLHSNSNYSSPSQSVVSDSNVGSLFAGAAKLSSKYSSSTSSTRSISRFSSDSETKEMDPGTSGALQFLPAYSQSSNRSAQPSWEDSNRSIQASWDALLDNEGETKSEVESNIASSLVARAFETKQRRRAPRPRAPDDQSDVGGKGRIARLSMLFGNRTPIAHSDVTPASPATSSSSGYVGWPGTQDARGHVKSYDDSSAGPLSDSGFSDKLSDVRSNTEPSKTFSASRYAQSDIGTQSHPRIAPSQLAPRRKRFSKQVSPASSTSSSAFMNDTDVDKYVYPFYEGQGKRSDFSTFRQSENGKYVTETKSEAPYGFRLSKNGYGENSVASDYRRLLKKTERNIEPPSVAIRPRRLYGEGARVDSPKAGVPPEQAQPITDKDETDIRGVAPTKELLEANDRLSAPHRTFKGYQGLLNKTKDVPCLMDGNDSDTSSRATSVLSIARKKGLSGSDSESDVFDGVASVASSYNAGGETGARPVYPASIAEEEENTNEFSVVRLRGGLTAIQSTSLGFNSRDTASDFDDQLTNSEVDQHGFAQIPSFHEMISRGTSSDNSLHGIHGNFSNSPPTQISQSRTTDDSRLSAFSDEGSSSFFPDTYDQDLVSLSSYRVDERDMKKLVRYYRRFSENVDPNMDVEALEREEDEHKAFALFEMRSRIMEKDIERGLERRGGTLPVDDLVTTSYYRTGLRIRDACIVSKAWRDGVNPMDVINSSELTRRAELTYFIRRPAVSRRTSSYRYTWEAVKWIDDTDFMLYRCPSLGPRNMRGFEMFTVGDCQSMLLKLSHEQCEALREELNDATRRQIEAEDLLHREADGHGNDTMTVAEMEYLAAMEEVKTISKKLVDAEQSFTLVRDRIQELVHRYQAMLAKIEAESCAGASSVITFDESSCHSDNDSQYWEEQDILEQEKWARRAQRAELRAELAAREALLAKRQVHIIQEQKQKELEDLRQRLMELQSETSSAYFGNRNHSAALAKGYARSQEGGSKGSISKERLDGVKQRFRDRIAAKKESMLGITSPAATPTRSAQQVTPSPPGAKGLFMAAGEEMYSHLDFYERSLRAVETAKHY